MYNKDSKFETRCLLSLTQIFKQATQNSWATSFIRICFIEIIMRLSYDHISHFKSQFFNTQFIIVNYLWRSFLGQHFDIRNQKDLNANTRAMEFFLLFCKSGIVLKCTKTNIAYFCYITRTMNKYNGWSTNLRHRTYK